MEKNTNTGVHQADPESSLLLRKSEEYPPHSKDIQVVSPAVVKRLPRYFRFLRELLDMDILRISSRELSAKMHVTASQIRQDLNCFGGFGQQGYGYNVRLLYAKIGELLAVTQNYSAILIGAGHLGGAIASSALLSDRNVRLLALFDTDPARIGQTVSGFSVKDAETLPQFLCDTGADIAILTLPAEAAARAVDRLADLGIRGIWNFSGSELTSKKTDLAIENVHLDDSLMRLMYHIRVGHSGDEA